MDPCGLLGDSVLLLTTSNVPSGNIAVNDPPFVDCLPIGNDGFAMSDYRSVVFLLFFSPLK